MPPCKFFALVYRTIFRSLQYQKRSPLSMSFCSFIGEHKRNLDGHCLKLGTFCEDWPTQIQMAKTLGEHCCCTTLFRNKRFILNLIPQTNASKFAILLSYENPRWHGSLDQGIHWWGFVIQMLGKFWSISLGYLVQNKPHISEECAERGWKKLCCCWIICIFLTKRKSFISSFLHTGNSLHSSPKNMTPLCSLF